MSDRAQSRLGAGLVGVALVVAVAAATALAVVASNGLLLQRYAVGIPAGGSGGDIALYAVALAALVASIAAASWWAGRRGADAPSTRPGRRAFAVWLVVVTGVETLLIVGVALLDLGFWAAAGGVAPDVQQATAPRFLAIDAGPSIAALSGAVLVLIGARRPLPVIAAPATTLVVLGVAALVAVASPGV